MKKFFHARKSLRHVNSIHRHLPAMIFGTLIASVTVASAGPYSVYGMGEPNPVEVNIPKAARNGTALGRDLEILEVTATTEEAPVGMVRITARVANAGSVDIGPTDTMFLDGKKVIGSIATSAMRAGSIARIWIDCRLDASDKPHVLTARADATHRITETNKRNNAKTVVVQLTGNEVAKRD